eukprot:TRINITY_DN735_c0_g1_i1.p1 TRINITY_DN735_c0_g1~~TRINITY_DN735_c0_g1_i1.p1  ORF type:complete len:277 (+),score=48.16 TRINITY_DN735_c0_g1_i1:1097-1927(+)
MGGNNSHQARPTSQNNADVTRGAIVPRFAPIFDKYKSLEEVQDALRKAGLESSNLIFGIDYTKSNTWNGKQTFGGHSLHAILPGILNPYQEAITIIGKTLEAFDDDKLIPTFGFGDVQSADKTVFPFYPDKAPYTFREVLERYNEITPLLVFSGPTSFAPLIRQAIEIVKATRAYHILVILADGEVTSVKETSDAIVEASSYPLSIIMIGVGDGPFTLMETFDDGLPQRRFDNFQFVNMSAILREVPPAHREIAFSVSALMELPDQYLTIRKLNLL